MRVTGHQQLRYLFGLLLIVSSLYALYIAGAFKMTPDLMLVPEENETAACRCTQVTTTDLEACIPYDLKYEVIGSSIRFYSLQARISGTIMPSYDTEMDNKLRKAVNKPLARLFTGDIDNKTTWEIVRIIFKHRYNPVFIGIRSGIVPSWMRGDEKSNIIIPEGVEGIGFTSSNRKMGLVFDENGLIVIRMNSSNDKSQLSCLMRASILRSADKR